MSSHHPFDRLRVGHGYDIHPLVEGRRLVLGGEVIPYPRGLAGHSDADVLLHALGDAILGAAALGDLGAHFPPTDPRWRDASSVDLLERIMALVVARGSRIIHCDLTVIAEAPKVEPHRAAIQQRIAGILGVAADRVGVKATTNERLGALGRGEGIAAMAVVLMVDGEA